VGAQPVHEPAHAAHVADLADRLRGVRADLRVRGRERADERHHEVRVADRLRGRDRRQAHGLVGVVHGAPEERAQRAPGADLEVDGLLYEAFNTSGGLGTLAETYEGKVRTMNYKTLRYPGHCEKIHFLMEDLKLNQDRDTLKRILENAIPKTLQDVVLIYASVTGKQKGELYEENYVKKVYPQKISGILWSAIQVTTAAGGCAIVDMVFQRDDPAVQQVFGLD